MRWLLDKVGSLFVYRSPKHLSGYYRFLQPLPSRQLRKLAGTRSHLSKKKLIDIILTDMDHQCSIQMQYIRGYFWINQQVQGLLIYPSKFSYPTPSKIFHKKNFTKKKSPLSGRISDYFLKIGGSVTGCWKNLTVLRLRQAKSSSNNFNSSLTIL